jgi:general secretion pathway protein M
MKDWLLGLDPRERLLLAVAAGVLVLLMLVLLVWVPIHSAYSTLQSDVAEQRDTVLWMQSSAAKLTQLQRSGGAVQGLGGRSLLAVTDSTARASGLGPALRRVEPEGTDSVKVWLEGASFDVLVKWLGTLSATHGIDAETATLERGDAAGRVNARLSLQAAGS